MSADNLIGKKIRLVLTNNFHYTGKVIDFDDKTITLIDRKNARVTITRHSILIQEEVSE